MLVRDAIEITGGLSAPTKMPGMAWGTPAIYCKRGSKLREVKGTTCSMCYARKGRYVFDNVRNAYERRFRKYNETPKHVWVEAMAVDIASKCHKVPYFRFLDSGDLQNVDMLLSIFNVCWAVPQVNFWLSTRERLIVKQTLKDFVQPSNLVIRVSADMIDGLAPSDFTHTSTVKSGVTKEGWAELVKNQNTADNWTCPAPTQGNECGACRACWSPDVKSVTYKRH